jgi:geranylgeranyl diphosphate synthase type I
MFTLAYLALVRLREKGVADEKITNCAEMLSLACLELCEGQYLDVEYESRLDITVEDYLDMASKKTAALFGASTSLGAYLGSGDDKLVDSFQRFGKELGTAYQIRDDILGIWGEEESVGKSAGDISQRKKTLPVVYGLQNSEGEARKGLEKLYSQKSVKEDDIKWVTEILERSGARDYAGDLAEKYYHKALAHLDATGLGISSLGLLKEAAGFLWKRDF